MVLRKNLFTFKIVDFRLKRFERMTHVTKQFVFYKDYDTRCVHCAKRFITRVEQVP